MIVYQLGFLSRKVDRILDTAFYLVTHFLIMNAPEDEIFKKDKRHIFSLFNNVVLI